MPLRRASWRVLGAGLAGDRHRKPDRAAVLVAARVDSVNRLTAAGTSKRGDAVRQEKSA